MLSVAVIIFRETLEIALMLGIVLSATRGLAGRMPWILGGFALGAAGAGLVAVFAETISGLAQGAGQEIFNAGILFVAAGFIGCTALWMKAHGREASNRMKQVGHDVTEGILPLSALAFIIGLSLLREGSEIVLFVYGMVLSGLGTAAIAAGSVTGVLCGVAVGAALYEGLLRISLKHVFSVTGWLLVLLVAGLAAQGAGYLSAAGYFPKYSGTLWNSSWLIRDDGFAGQALHGLIGYSARPTVIQGLVYIVTLGGLVFAMNMNIPARRVVRAAAVLLVLAAIYGSHKAWALDNIYSPNIEEGEWEVEYSGSRSIDSDRTRDNAQTHEVSVGYGFSRWRPELTGVFEKEPGEGTDLKEIEFENTFQFFEPGEHWADTGLLLAWGHALRDRDRPDAIEAKLLLEKQAGPFLHRANIGFEQEAGLRATGGADISVLWSSRYRLMPEFEPGLEIQSGFGKTGQMHGYDAQEHYIGPAVYGRVFSHVAYEVAWLAGASRAATDSAVRAKLEYELHF